MSAPDVDIAVSPGNAADQALLPVAVMVSGHGRGSNLRALVEACVAGAIPARIAVVIGTRTAAPAIEFARQSGIPVAIISPRRYENDDEGYAAALSGVLARHNVGLICLAGYMRMLPDSVVAAYRNRIMNVHAALLPLFGGRGMFGENVHRAVLESGMKVSGCTVHFVDEHYDTGPIIVQRTVPVMPDDTPETLAARVLAEEHRAYVQAVGLFAEGRLRVEGRRVIEQTPRR